MSVPASGASLSPLFIPTVSDLEKKFDENPDAVTDLIAKTRLKLSESQHNEILLRRARTALERSIDDFYRKRIDDIALSSYKK